MSKYTSRRRHHRSLVSGERKRRKACVEAVANPRQAVKSSRRLRMARGRRIVRRLLEGYFLGHKALNIPDERRYTVPSWVTAFSVGRQAVSIVLAASRLWQGLCPMCGGHVGVSPWSCLAFVIRNARGYQYRLKNELIPMLMSGDREMQHYAVESHRMETTRLVRLVTAWLPVRPMLKAIVVPGLILADSVASDVFNFWRLLTGRKDFGVPLATRFRLWVRAESGTVLARAMDSWFIGLWTSHLATYTAMSAELDRRQARLDLAEQYHRFQLATRQEELDRWGGRKAKRKSPDIYHALEMSLVKRSPSGSDW